MFALYIPIWLYSDVGGYRSGEYNEYFTFQSGYIPTVELLHARTLVHLALHSNLVIFQPFYSISCKMHIELYIPIWLYYNKNFNFVLGGRSFFTFQSGYIPTKNLIQMTRQDIWLYIPIWLYSNTVGLITTIFPFFFTFQSGYIPTYRKNHYFDKKQVFTFQSGYIPTFSHKDSLIYTFIALHSTTLKLRLFRVSLQARLTTIWNYNLVIFQYPLIHLYVASNHWALHSNLVIFQCMRVSVNKIRQLLYIPIWLYSNCSKNERS